MKTTDLKSRIGYYFEICVAWHLRSIMKENGYKYEGVSFGHKKSLYRKNKIEYTRFNSREEENKFFEIERTEDAAEKVAIQIYNDNISHLNKFCQLSIELVGESNKFDKSSSADLVIAIRESKSVIRKHISLKKYSQPGINLVNGTFVSSIHNWFFPEVGPDLIGKQFLKALEESNETKHMKEIYEIQEFINFWHEDKRLYTRKRTTPKMNDKNFRDGKSRYDIVRDLFIKVFNEQYSKNKECVRNNIRTGLGLGNDIIYISIIKGLKAKDKGAEIISTYNNPEFNKVVELINGEFTIKVKKISNDVNSFEMLFYAKGKKSPFLKSTIPIKEECKLNSWVNFKNFNGNKKK